ncbi:MAG: metal-dependent transcriptional regulator [Cellulosilyticaceae bacterium]
MISYSLEKYLIEVYKIDGKQEEIKISDVSKNLNISLKKVMQAIQRMHYQHYIIYKAYQPLVITEKGKEMAKFLISKNILIKEFMDILQIPVEVEDEDNIMKQNLSYEMLESMEKFVAFAKQNPEFASKYKSFNKEKFQMHILEALPKD